LKRISGKQMCKILRKRGWILERVSGSHHLFKMPGLAQLVNVPVHANKTLKPKTQRSVMKAAGLTDDDL
jgi:predicted RNA binding protein YcfA (HicA-like mRNA interferase family)